MRRYHRPKKSEPKKKKKKTDHENYLERKKWQQIWIDRHGGSKWY